MARTFKKVPEAREFKCIRCSRLGSYDSIGRGEFPHTAHCRTGELERGEFCPDSGCRDGLRHETQSNGILWHGCPACGQQWDATTYRDSQHYINRNLDYYEFTQF